MIRPFRPFSHEFPNCTIRNGNVDGILDFSIGSNDFQDDATATLTMLEDSREEELSASLTNRRKRPKLNTQVAMEKALKASAVVEHTAQSKYTFQANILYYESNLRLRKIKEALYIRYITTYNRDLGDVGMIWSNVIDCTNRCSLSPVSFLRRKTCNLTFEQFQLQRKDN
ncbi:hypothetical protein M513_09671 [Trichuris suis]|uniref:Uncharacterized protein n=1 Tax=Trichuris suis TaxID=68888 RepID=A0A085LWQ8_9BILA|nr:hypothetical protein M513_09671 [Trichuris suis]